MIEEENKIVEAVDENDKVIGNTQNGREKNQQSAPDRLGSPDYRSSW